MLGHELITPLIIIISSMITISVLVYLFSGRIYKSRRVKITNSGDLCTPSIGELDAIPKKTCTDRDGKTVNCFQPNPDVDLVFGIDVNPVYYRTVCAQLCNGITSNGECENKTPRYDECISQLKPPPNCNDSAKPLGRLTDTDNIYYAQSIIP
jgi:hypothetical protein